MYPTFIETVIIYINFVELEYPMLQAKIQDCKTSSAEEKYFNGFTIYGRLGYVTWTIYITFRSPFPWILHIKFGFDWPSGFRE